MRWTCELPFVTPSNNELLNMHWAERARLKTRMAWQIRSALNTIPHIPSASHKRRIIFVRHGKRRLDKDNLYGGIKLTLDIIKEFRVIVDDKPDWLDLEVEQGACGKAKPWTTFILETLDETSPEA
jgi:hypothetical protein